MKSLCLAAAIAAGCCVGSRGFAATSDFALSSAGASAVSNGILPENLINNRTREGTARYPRWTDVANPYFTINLPPRAAELPFEGIRLAGVLGAQPFTLDVLDASGGLLTAFSSNVPQASYDFVAPPGLFGASRLEFRQPGMTPPPLEIAEVYAWFQSGFRVGGAGIGQTTLTEVTFSGGAPGVFNKNLSVQLNQGSRMGLSLAELEILDGSGNPFPVTGWTSGGLQAGSMQQLTDGIVAAGNGATFSSYAGVIVQGSQGFSGLRFTTSVDKPAQDLSDLSVVVRNPNNSLDFYYTEPLSVVGTGPGQVVTFGFTFGRTARAVLESTETYEFEIDALADVSDALSVEKMATQTSLTVLDVNGSSLRLFPSGTPALGDTFQLLKADKIEGTFSQLLAPAIGGGLRWDFSQLYINGTVTVAVPEPNAVAQGVVIVLAALICMPRRRFAETAR